MFPRLVAVLFTCMIMIHAETCDPTQFDQYNEAVAKAEAAYLSTCTTEAEKAGLIQPNTTISAKDLDPKLCQVPGCYSLFGSIRTAFPDCSATAGDPTLLDTVTTAYAKCKAIYQENNNHGNQVTISIFLLSVVVFLQLTPKF